MTSDNSSRRPVVGKNTEWMIPSDQMIIRRYKPLGYFAATLEDGFRAGQADEYEKREGQASEAAREYERQHSEQTGSITLINGEEMDLAGGFEQARGDSRTNYYANCWRLGTDEDPEIWERYANGRGVAIETTYEQLERCIAANQTVNFGKRADLLEEIFEEFTNRSLNALKARQIEDTNKKLEQILGLSKVQVEKIDNSIIIEGRDGASEGQSLSVAYAYLATLFEDSALNVPCVIDSPAVSIDYKKREKVAQIIPGLFNQLIIFVISPERQRFVDELDSDDIQYYTVHKTGTSGEVEKHTSKDFFMRFQSEEEQDAHKEVA